MSFWKKKKNDSPDVLEAYPERMQIGAIPERRYLRTARFLAVFTFLNLGVLIALGGQFVYTARRADISLSHPRAVYMYAIDTQQKTLKPGAHSETYVPGIQLMVEAVLRDYILKRHTFLWDIDAMKWRWGPTGTIALYSTRDVMQKFGAESTSAANSAQATQTVRDVHLYDLQYLGYGLWQGIFDIFHLPIPDPFNPLCGACSDNAPTCLSCKTQHASKKQRFKVYVRTAFTSPPNQANPLGISIIGYYKLVMPIHPEEKVWDIPSILKPEI